MVTAGARRLPLHRMSAFCKAGTCRAKSVAKVVEAVQSRPVRVMIYVGSKIYINEYSNRDFVANYRVEGFHANKIVVEDIAGEIRKNHLNVTKVYALGEREVLEQALAEIRPLPGLTITSSGSDNFEILPAGADKGRALTRLGEMFGVTPAEMVAIGDSDNDAEMLRAVGMPVRWQRGCSAQGSGKIHHCRLRPRWRGTGGLSPIQITQEEEETCRL